MKSILRGCLVLVVALAFFQGVASAKTISGKIVNIDPAGNKLSVSYTDLASGTEEKVEVSVKPETTYSGVASFQDLKEGQAVVVETAEGTEAEGLSATSIKIEAGEPVAVESEEKVSSPALALHEETAEHKM